MVQAKELNKKKINQNPINLKTFFIFHFAVKSQQAKLFTLNSFVCENANITQYITSTHTHTHTKLMIY